MGTVWITRNATRSDYPLVIAYFPLNARNYRFKGRGRIIILHRTKGLTRIVAPLTRFESTIFLDIFIFYIVKSIVGLSWA